MLQYWSISKLYTEPAAIDGTSKLRNYRKKEKKIKYIYKENDSKRAEQLRIKKTKFNDRNLERLQRCSKKSKKTIRNQKLSKSLLSS